MTTNVLAAAQVVAAFSAVQYLWGLNGSGRNGLGPYLLRARTQAIVKIAFGTFAGLASLTYVPIQHGWKVIVACFIASMCIAWLRSTAQKQPRYMTMLELIGATITGAIGLATYWLLPSWKVLWPVLTSKAVLVFCINTAVASYLIVGGSQVVRGVLELCGTLPKTPSLEDLDQTSVDTQLRTGRYIGVLERLIV